jgi:hypothetical protein
VYLALAPFMEPERLRAIFGRDLLAEEHQREGFALLTATGGHKPFECVGEEAESAAALRLLAEDARWRDHAVVAALARALPPAAPGEVSEILQLSEDHDVPSMFRPQVDALLGA